VALKCGLTGAKIDIFWYKFAPKGYIPLSDFYKIWHGEQLPSLHPLAKFNYCAEIGNFWYKFAQKGYTP